MSNAVFIVKEMKFFKKNTVSGDNSGGATPVPIPNTEVKPSCADGTAGVTLWESRSLPEFNLKGGLFLVRLFFRKKKM